MTDNGKEKQISQSLHYLDYGARMYDDFLGRWFTQDLLQEKRFWFSSYNFCSNNPVGRTDLTGMLDTDYRNEQGDLLYKTEDGLKDVIIVPKINIPKLEKKLNETYEDGTIDDPTTNQEEMHGLGRTPQEYSEEATKGMDDYWTLGYEETYEEAYTEGKSQFSIGQILSSIVAAIASDNDDNTGEMRHGGRSSGISDGNYDRKNGKINRLSPYSSFKNNEPLFTIPKPKHPYKYPGVGLPPK